MGVKVRGINQVSNNLSRIVNDISVRRPMRAITSALITIGEEAALMTPVATSVLLNSAFRHIETKGSKFIGKVGYTAKYAAAVHEAKGVHLGKRTLRPVGKGDAKGSLGYIWDKTGEPKFLEKAAEKTKGRVDDIIRKEMSL